MTASTLYELIAGLPHSSLPKVTGEPTFEDLKLIRRLLNINAMSVASYVGGGSHGHLGIIMTNEEYFSIAAHVFPVPNNPGASADKLLPLPQPPVRARTDARMNPSAQRATQLRRVLARVYAVSIQNQITTTVP
jgi:hypothetical protein